MFELPFIAMSLISRTRSQEKYTSNLVRLTSAEEGSLTDLPVKDWSVQKYAVLMNELGDVDVNGKHHHLCLSPGYSLYLDSAFLELDGFLPLPWIVTVVLSEQWAQLLRERAPFYSIDWRGVG